MKKYCIPLLLLGCLLQVQAVNVTPTISSTVPGFKMIGTVYYVPISEVNGTNTINYNSYGLSFTDYPSTIGGSAFNWRIYPNSSSDWDNKGWLQFPLQSNYDSFGENARAIKEILINDQRFAYYPIQSISTSSTSSKTANLCTNHFGVCPDWALSNLYTKFGPFMKIAAKYYPYKVTTNWTSNPYAITDIASDTYLQFYTPENEIVCTAPNHLITVEPGHRTVTRWEKSVDNGMTWTNIENTKTYYYEAAPQQGTYLYRALRGSGYTPIKTVTYQDSLDQVTIEPSTLSGVTGDQVTLSVKDSRPDFSYQWYKGNAKLSGETNSTLSLSTTTPATSGTYTCKVTTPCNTVTSNTSTITINKAPQTINFPDIPTKYYGDSSFTLPSTTDKGFTIIYQSTNTSVATVSGNTVTIVAPGTANIVASQAGNTSFLAATSVTRTLTVNKGLQTIDFPSIEAKTYGDGTFTLPKTTDKGLAISYSSSNTNVATVSGNVVTIKNAGITDIIANQAGTSLYSHAPTISQTLTVNKAPQTITFAAIPEKTYGDATITLNQNTDKGLAISYASSNTDLASISGNIVTIKKPGTVQITATQPGSDNYLAAAQVVQTLTIKKATQTITWSALPNKKFGDPSFNISATSNRGLTVTFTSNDEKVAKVSGSQISIIGAGNVDITANQEGNEYYEAATPMTQTLYVSKASQTISMTNWISSYVYGRQLVQLQATSSSGEKVSFESSNPMVASISDNIMSIMNAGQCTITANVLGNANYYAGTPVSNTLIVTKAPLTISAVNDTIEEGAPMPAFKLSFNGFIGSDTESDLDSKPSISCSATSSSAAGTYDIILQGGTDNNYNFNLVNGKRVIKISTGLEIVSIEGLIIYPVPTKGLLNYKTECEIKSISIYSLDGRLIKKFSGINSSQIDISDLPNGIFRIQFFGEKTSNMNAMVIKN